VVDAGAVERNCRVLTKRVGEGTELCAVVKANGYGHGAAACAAAAMRGGATRLAVAAAAEAEELRLHFPDTPILVMGALTPDELRIALTARADVAVWREDFRELCSRIAGDLGRMARVHVKLDSGM
jgi:alanine racemase